MYSSAFEDSFYNQPIVIDNGTNVIKGGFTGETKPRCLEYSIVGTPKYDKIMQSNGIESDSFIGNKAQKYRGILKLRHPMLRGVVQNWDDMETIWQYVFDDTLYLENLNEHPILITEPPLNNMANRQKMCEALFEIFGFPAVYISVSPVLSLYASGQTTGCAVDCGDGYCTSIPVYNGFSLASSVKKIDIGGCDITEQLQFSILKNTGLFMYSSSEREIVRTIKEKVCYIATDYNLETEKYLFNEEKMASQFKLPDGKMLNISQGKYTSTEILFRPELIGSEFDSLPEICYQSIKKVDSDLRLPLYSNIVLSGGTTMCPGFGSRLLKELQTLTGYDTKIRIIAPPERKYTSWIGGSILSGLSTFSKIWVTKSMWEEDNKIIHSKIMH
ncbi:hypothetical protein KAFR_0F00590 [Kazachstania africana CBS 2517]|uniref:Centractin n=1 Tax=Kazachstania africana (strain ATCC 22294 / BCRC 22015 / CBS 2517 / CECT 1963 / NBRC 1671 / NRRL Y-8276) TaxID=1071382 RepID=H2AWA6_KAZAF|nr:hypothetical protein KAFR_0F00590 [Kazachstania africana CBS 2517]CCF58656.1 hypothetical protein KAFR_0F00590 [Kazachstania africana CBS 2517]